MQAPRSVCSDTFRFREVPSVAYMQAVSEVDFVLSNDVKKCNNTEACVGVILSGLYHQQFSLCL